MLRLILINFYLLLFHTLHIILVHIKIKSIINILKLQKEFQSTQNTLPYSQKVLWSKTFVFGMTPRNLKPQITLIKKKSHTRFNEIAYI